MNLLKVPKIASSLEEVKKLSENLLVEEKDSDDYANVKLPEHLVDKHTCVNCGKPAKFAKVRTNEVIGEPVTQVARVNAEIPTEEIEKHAKEGTERPKRMAKVAPHFGIPADDVYATSNKGQSRTGQISVVQGQHLVHNSSEDLDRIARKRAGFITGESFDENNPSHQQRLKKAVGKLQAEDMARFGPMALKKAGFSKEEAFNPENRAHADRLGKAMQDLKSHEDFKDTEFATQNYQERALASEGFDTKNAEPYDEKDPVHFGRLQSEVHLLMKSAHLKPVKSTGMGKYHEIKVGDEGSLVGKYHETSKATGWNLQFGRPEVKQVRHYRVSDIGRSAIPVCDSEGCHKAVGFDLAKLASLSSRKSGAASHMLVSYYEPKAKKTNDPLVNRVVFGERGTRIVPEEFEKEPVATRVSTNFKHSVVKEEKDEHGNKALSVSIEPTVSFLDWHASLNAYRDKKQVDLERIQTEFAKKNKRKNSMGKPKEGAPQTLSTRSTRQSFSGGLAPNVPSKELGKGGKHAGQRPLIAGRGPDINLVPPGSRADRQGEQQEKNKEKDRLSAVYSPEETEQFNKVVMGAVVSGKDPNAAALEFHKKLRASQGGIFSAPAEKSQLKPPKMPKKP